jgi:peptidoglycan/LPS O-acetylase OafA/YrhL
MSEQDIPPLRRLSGNALSAVGILWLALCGGCSTLFAFQSVGFGGFPNALAWIGLCVLVGAICALPGGALLLIGRWLLRRRR